MPSDPSAHLPTEDETATPAPIWAPNPAVPLLARLLAYLFGGLMLLAVVLSSVTERPPDTAPSPEVWKWHAFADGSGFPYPAEWVLESKSINQGVEVRLALTESSPVRVDALLLTLPRQIGRDDLAQLDESLAAQMRSRFTEFTLDPPSGSGLRSFCYDLVLGAGAQAARLPMRGAWIVQVKDHRALLLIGMTPSPGWATMEFILLRIARKAQLS
jgi:hypothetical protein